MDIVMDCKTCINEMKNENFKIFIFGRVNKDKDNC